MTELISALVGALVGGALSYGAVIWQTRKTLDHDVQAAREERQVARDAEAAARVTQAALRHMEPLADYLTPRVRDDPRTWFGGATTEPEFSQRKLRVHNLRRAGLEYGYLLPDHVSQRWRNLVWAAQWCSRPDASQEPHWDRDAYDAWNYGEYVRRSLVAVVNETPLPQEHARPDPERDDDRPWSFRPPPDADEPDYTDWGRRRLGAAIRVKRVDGTLGLNEPE